MTIDLKDGSSLRGLARTIKSVFHTSYATIELQLAAIESITFMDRVNEVTCVMRNGDILRGTLDLEAITVDALKGLVTVPCSRIRKISLTSPITISGSEGFDWMIRTTNSKSWKFTNSGGVLCLKHIEASKADPGGWATIKLTHSLEECHDFKLMTKISWDAPGPHAMHCLGVRLAGSKGAIASVWHSDPWVLSLAGRESYVEEHHHQSGHDTQPLSGSASIAVIRTDGEVRIVWNGKPMQVGMSSRPLVRISMLFRFYPYDLQGRKSVFGSLAVRRLQLITPATQHP